MIIGLTGAHRSGKSTLAKAVAEDLGITFLPQSFGEAARRHGVDAVAPMTLLDRVSIQEKILEDHAVMVRDIKGIILVDRTPVDYLAYLLGEFHMQSHLSVDPAVLERVHTYKERALDVVDSYYESLFVVQPLDHYAVEEGKPAFNRAYQDHIQLLIDGACMNLEGTVTINWVNVTDLEERRAAVNAVIVKRLDELEVFRTTSPHVH